MEPEHDANDEGLRVPAVRVHVADDLASASPSEGVPRVQELPVAGAQEDASASPGAARGEAEGVTVPIHEKGWGIVFHRFWRDAKREAWTDDERTAALYLLTCEARTLEGLYVLRLDYAATDLGWAESRLAAAIDGLSVRGFCAYDAPREVMFIAKSLKAQTPDSRPQIDGALARLRKIPASSPLLPYFARACREFSEALWDSLPEGYREASERLSEGTPPRSEIGDRRSEIGRPEDQSLGVPGDAGSVSTPARIKARRSAPAYPPGFLAAWAAYPHHATRSAKAKAGEVWHRRKLEPLTESVLRWIAVGAESEDWRREGGQYVPGMQVWLGGRDFSEPPPLRVAQPLDRLSEHGRKTAAVLQAWVAKQEARA